MDVGKMEAGPELNALVAEGVMNYSHNGAGNLLPPNFAGTAWGALAHSGAPPYSTDIAASFEVDRLEWQWTFAEHPMWLTVLLWRQPEDSIVYAGSTVTLDTGPIATAHVKWDEAGTKAEVYALGRCRAALKAVERLNS